MGRTLLYFWSNPAQELFKCCLWHKKLLVKVLVVKPFHFFHQIVKLPFLISFQEDLPSTSLRVLLFLALPTWFLRLIRFLKRINKNNSASFFSLSILWRESGNQFELSNYLRSHFLCEPIRTAEISPLIKVRAHFSRVEIPLKVLRMTMLSLSTLSSSVLSIARVSYYWRYTIRYINKLTN